MGLFTISCKKATYLVSKKEEGKLNWIEKIQLRSHMTTCSLCRLFDQHTEFIKYSAQHQQPDEKLREEVKVKIEQVLVDSSQL